MDVTRIDAALTEEFASAEERRRWQESLKQARTIFGAEIAALEDRIEAKRAIQRELMDLAGAERRTLDRQEQKVFDLAQGYVDEARRKIRAIVARGHVGRFGMGG